MAISDLVYIDAAGFHIPDYPTILQFLKDEYKTIYGNDVYLEADSQDGQWIAIQALAIFDTLQVAQATYNSFSPLTAQSDALSRNVKINGIRRLSASFSQVDLVIIGQAGTVISNGQAEDTLNQKWNLPATVTIPVGGETTVTATAAEIGAKTAQAGTITKIATPTLGWQSVNNPSPAASGNPIETDAELRKRQSLSVSLPARTVFESTLGSVALIEGVSRFIGYENDSDAVDSDGLPAHSIAVVVEGGDAKEIGEAIAKKKTPGTGTYGSTAITVYDEYGMPNEIRFSRPTIATISVEVTIVALQGYTSAVPGMMTTAISDLINSLQIGEDVLVTKLYGPALLSGNAAYSTFDVSQIRVKKNSGAYGTANIPLAFNEVAYCDHSANVTVIVT